MGSSMTYWLRRRGVHLGLLAGIAVFLAVGGILTVSGKGGNESNNGKGNDKEAGTSLNTSKSAEGFWVQEIDHDWTINKTVSPTSLTLAIGDSGLVDYVLDIQRSAPPAQDIFGVRGEVCVTNSGDRATEGLKIEDQVQFNIGDEFQDLAGATRTIVPPVQLLPGETQCYPYEIEFDPVSGAVYRNTAHVTITNHSGSLGEAFGPTPKADFGLPSSPTIVELDATAQVNDLATAPANFSVSRSQSFPVMMTGSGRIAYSATITNEGEFCGQSFDVSNTATVTASDTGEMDSDGSLVTVSTGVCPTPTPTPEPEPEPTATPIVSDDLQGCTPGFWKNHVGHWDATAYSPHQSVDDVFDPAGLVDQFDTLEDAVNYKGGGKDKVAGAARTLLRAATAGILNASHPDVNYFFGASSVIASTNAAIASGDPETMLFVESQLDEENNRGCPLS